MQITLAGLLVVPLVSLIALWTFAASITLGSALREHNYNRLVALSAAPTDRLANQVSQERQRTFTWLSTDPRPAAAQPAQTTLLTLLSRLPTIRASVDAEVLSPAAAFAAYSNIMNAIFSV